MHELRKFADAVLGESSPLLLSRVVSALVTVWLPLALVRVLAPDVFGGYKQFFLIAQTALLVGQIGITQSLYYFLPRGGPMVGAYLTHALLALCGLGIAAGVVLYAGAPVLTALLASPVLLEERVPLAVCVCAMLAAAPLEIALVAQQRVKTAGAAYALSDAIRALALLAAAILSDQHLMFWTAAGVAWLRVAALGAFVASGILQIAVPSAAAWKAQMSFALPFAGSGLFMVLQRYFAQYAVSSTFDPAIFAVFTVASFHMFVVDIIVGPVTDVLTVRLSRILGGEASTTKDTRAGAAVDEWDRAVKRTASLLFPFAAASIALGPVLVPALFTTTYAGAVPLFLLVSLQIPLFSAPAESVLWAAGESRFLLRVAFARTPLTIAGVLVGLGLLGLPGAILGSLVSDVCARIVLLLRANAILGVRRKAILDWAALAPVALAATCAAIGSRTATLIPLPGPVQLATGVLAFAAVYLLILTTLEPRLLRIARGIS
ncbi:MAG: hypothetical protein NVSMB2_22890 [Chloroflexota bacterium]